MKNYKSFLIGCIIGLLASATIEKLKQYHKESNKPISPISYHAKDLAGSECFQTTEIQTILHSFRDSNGLDEPSIALISGEDELMKYSGFVWRVLYER